MIVVKKGSFSTALNKTSEEKYEGPKGIASFRGREAVIFREVKALSLMIRRDEGEQT